MRSINPSGTRKRPHTEAFENVGTSKDIDHEQDRKKISTASDADTIKDRLADCLNEVSNGSFAFGDMLLDAPNPLLFLQGYDYVRFPLGPSDIRMVREASGDTGASVASAETTTPGVWHLPHGSWNIGNSDWEQKLTLVARITCSKLGIPFQDDFRLVPDCLVLEEAGSEIASVE